MHYPPPLHRLRRRPAPAAALTLLRPGGGVALDVAGVLAQLAVRELLDGSGVRGRV